MIYKKIVASIRLHSPYLMWAEQGRTAEEIKTEILTTLKPHFQNPSVLDKIPLPILAHEAVAIGNIQSDPWSSSTFAEVLALYREALVRDQAACLAAIEFWDEPIARAMSEFMSIYLMEADRDELALEEFRLEVFRNLGGVLEACVQPQLKALLHITRIRSGRSPLADDILALPLGAVVDELHQKLKNPSIVAPPPWGIKLNYWRNIAQHHSTVTQGTHVVCSYRIGSAKHQIALTRPELLSLVMTMQAVLGSFRAARSVFIADNSLLLQNCKAAQPRQEILFFHLAVGIATQGFDIVDVEITQDSAHLRVRDLTDRDPMRRGIHASQFVVGIWKHFSKPLIRITYADKSGHERLEATATGSDCEDVAENRVPFEALAERLNFRVLGRDSEEGIKQTYRTP